jgi:hypothetical protein
MRSMWAGAISFGPLPGGDLLHFAPADPFWGY